MKILLFLFVLLSTNAFAESYVGGIACNHSGNFKLRGYGHEEDLLAYEGRTLDEILAIGLKRISYKDFNSTDLYENRFEEIKQTEIRSGYKLRLQDTDENCEGIFTITPADEVWISGDVFNELSNLEKAIVYVEILLAQDGVGNLDRKVIPKRAGFYFSLSADLESSSDMLSAYRNYIGKDDPFFRFGNLLFNTRNLNVSNEVKEGRVSNYDYYIGVNSSAVNLKDSYIKFTENEILSIIFPTVQNFILPGGYIKSKSISLDIDSIRCAKLADYAFLKTVQHDYRIYETGMNVCFLDGLVEVPGLLPLY